MNELMETAFSTVNLPYTVLLLVIVLYWLLVIIGLMDIGAFDFDLDTDFDLEMDGSGGIPGLGPQMVGFLNVGEVPVMFYLSVVILSMWIGSVETNAWLGNENVWIALALAVPNLIVGLLVAKVATQPLKWLNIRKKETNKFAGMLCVVTTTEVTETFGECEIQIANTPVKIFARTRGGEVLKKGDAAVVVQRLKHDDNLYVVTKHQREK